MSNNNIPLIQLDNKKNKLSVYVSDDNINAKPDWRKEVSYHMLKFLQSNTNGICQVKIKIDDYKPFLKDLLDYFDIRYPKRIYIRLL